MKVLVFLLLFSFLFGREVVEHYYSAVGEKTSIRLGYGKVLKVQHDSSEVAVEFEGDRIELVPLKGGKLLIPVVVERRGRVETVLLILRPAGEEAVRKKVIFNLPSPSSVYVYRKGHGWEKITLD